MPPKCRFTREEVVRAALDMTREAGPGAVTARALGERLGASARPIFSLFSSLSEVQREVLLAAWDLFRRFIREDMESGRWPPYKASGMAYIRFAREEPELFRLLFMCAREGEKPPQRFDEVQPVIDALRGATGLSEADAAQFHLEMWVFVHGIAVMIATRYLDWDEETVSAALTDLFFGLRRRFAEKEAQDGSHPNGKADETV